jgi:hypothetical protein
MPKVHLSVVFVASLKQERLMEGLAATTPVVESGIFEHLPGRWKWNISYVSRLKRLTTFAAGILWTAGRKETVTKVTTTRKDLKGKKLLRRRLFAP